MLIGNTGMIRAGLLAGAILAVPALSGTGAAAGAGGNFDIAGTFSGEHGTAAHPSGTVSGHYDAGTGKLTYDISYSGLSGPVIAAHFHGPAGLASEAGVMLPIAAPYASPIDETVVLTPVQAREIRTGKVYVNLHTAASPGGEARAQLSAHAASSN